MSPSAAGAVEMWESGAFVFAGFPSAEGSGGNSSLLLEFSTLPSAPHFHSAGFCIFRRNRTPAPGVRRPAERWSGGGSRLRPSPRRRALAGQGRGRGHDPGGLTAEREDPLQFGIEADRELKRIKA